MTQYLKIPTAALVALLLMLSEMAFATPQFEPFSEVKNVCSTCPAPPLDIVTLRSDKTVAGKIVGNNSDFYTIYRYGEYRAIPNNQVKAIKWGNGIRPDNLNESVQIVLQSGTIFNGKIKINNEKPGYIILELPELGQNITIFKDQIATQYVNGKKI